jgi:hypothetical protein
LVAAAAIAILGELYGERFQTLVLASQPERLGEWRRGLQDCLGLEREDFGPSSGIVLFERADALVERADRLEERNELPFIVIDAGELTIEVPILQFPLWLTFAAGPGEIALGAFKLALRDDEANWMASLANFLIHEVGLFVHGDNNQFVPYGGDGEPYNGLNGQRGALDLPGAPELLAEAWRRGAACSGDFSRLDHLALANEPLLEIRRRFHVLPLERPMLEEPEFWPSKG